MSDRKEFGFWTLAAAIGWLTGLYLAFLTIRALWAEWFRYMG